MKLKLNTGNSLSVLKTLPDFSVDSIVTDPPYELGFMGKKWDSTGIAYNKELWKECLRVLKPGGHLLAFSGTRTYHRMTVAIEDAGFEIRDQIQWIYGSGFPKSTDISKQIDKKAGAEREVVGFQKRGNSVNTDFMSGGNNITKPSTPDAIKWQGWGTALKPANEPICVARKPFKTTVAENVLKYGVGAMNIDESRIDYIDEKDGGDWDRFKGSQSSATIRKNLDGGHGISFKGRIDNGKKEGRWPANVIHDGSEEVVSLFPHTKSTIPSDKQKNGGNFPEENTIKLGLKEIQRTGFNDNGSAARFFYCAKASKKDRNEGLDSFELKASTEAKGNGLDRICNLCGAKQLNPCECVNNQWIVPAKQQNNHPTVKPTDLMAYLVRLVTPPGGTVLDPFNGSGSTGKACARLGFNYIGIDLSQEYIDISKARIEHELSKTNKEALIELEVHLQHEDGKSEIQTETDNETT